MMEIRKVSRQRGAAPDSARKPLRVARRSGGAVTGPFQVSSLTDERIFGHHGAPFQAGQAWGRECAWTFQRQEKSHSAICFAAAGGLGTILAPQVGGGNQAAAGRKPPDDEDWKRVDMFQHTTRWAVTLRVRRLDQLTWRRTIR